MQNHPASIQFLTLEREHLMTLSRTIFSAVDDAFLFDPKRPLIVSVNGSYGSGKKIIPDLASAALLGKRQKNENGNYNCDEYWIGKRNGIPVEIDFINIEAGNFGRKELNTLRTTSTNIPYDTYRQFLKQRRHGGISFVHNFTDFETLPDIEFYLETTLWEKVDLSDTGRLRHHPALLKEFNERVKGRAGDDWEEDELWVRFVEVTINNADLLASKPFTKVIQSLINQTFQPAVFGVSIPSP